MLIETGMRKGEAAALKWIDIDLDKHFITIDETLDFTAKNKEKLFGDTNRQWQEHNKGILGDRYHHDLDLVLCREDGNFMPKSSLFNAFSRILQRCDLPSLPIHSLRHTCAVLLLESRANMKFVQEQLGHGSIQITSDVCAKSQARSRKAI
ncbi:site-specific integrase [Paenibacillus sp. VT-400]|uniref:site-specific integrase n=1 Tax=Paenibacillus sp. VT-400 TaxID=1495853 RepID=UPI000AE39231|nr:site-specific integrase [Paenibacillus sp. VT-400]